MPGRRSGRSPTCRKPASPARTPRCGPLSSHLHPSLVWHTFSPVARPCRVGAWTVRASSRSLPGSC